MNKISIIVFMLFFAIFLFSATPVMAQRIGVNAEEFTQKVVSEAENANTVNPSDSDANIEWNDNQNSASSDQSSGLASSQ